MDIQKMVNNWLEGSEKDWLACQHLYESKDYSQCLFWGHLVLEKFLKALIIKTANTQAPYSHDLMLLASKIDLNLTPEKRDALNEITTFNQFARYDNEVMMFMQKCTPEYAEKYFYIIKDLHQWLKGFFHEKK